MTYHRRQMQDFCNGLHELLSESARGAEARAELDAISAAIGTNDYLDPPDGGSVPLAEQVARMAKDAARYRWLRKHGGEHQGPEVFIDGGYWLGTELDAQIDAHLT